MMQNREIVIPNKTGLHARPASDLVKLCKSFESNIDITVKDSGKKINAKSIISVLSGGLKQGTEIELAVEGSDENQAADEVYNYISNLTE
jgi:Phosphotransferase System HPr (HPr) Family